MQEYTHVNAWQRMQEAKTLHNNAFLFQAFLISTLSKKKYEN
jgi:hypothetical protein